MIDASIKTITQLIPQKEPFVMVDDLIDFSNQSLVSSFKIKEDNLFSSNGEFLEPGLIENMAQSVALHTGYDFYLKKETPPVGYIGSIKKTEIIALPKVGDTIKTKVSVLHEFMGVTMVGVKVFNNDNEIASAEMKTVIAS